jgi:lipoprotein-anchoring transpeptidase ErfK/SrfK
MGRATSTYMRLRTANVAGALIFSTFSFTLASDAGAQAGKKKAAPQAALPCGDLVGFQVLFDRHGVSSGQIDGKRGPNFSRALAAFQASRKLPVGPPDCATWAALGKDGGHETLTTYTITDEDVQGPFEPSIPAQLSDQAKLATLNYRSPIELVAERFHLSPALLTELNPGVAIAAGNQIKVPAVAPFDPETKPQPDGSAGDLLIEVSKDESALRATRPDGTLVFFAPASSGSVHDPLPIGDHKVRGVAWHPPFHYNPQLFWDARPADEKAKIPAGPNNPVGVVWIDLDLEHYGIHGTPEPGRVGHAESHGCVRLTNWDAARVASLVKPGTPVGFR